MKYLLISFLKQEGDYQITQYKLSDATLVKLDPAQRLDAILAILNVLSSFRRLQSLTMPIGVFTACPTVAIRTLSRLPELKALSFIPGLLSVPPFPPCPLGPSPYFEVLQKLDALSIVSSLTICADAIQILAASPRKLTLECGEPGCEENMATSVQRIIEAMSHTPSLHQALRIGHAPTPRGMGEVIFPTDVPQVVMTCIITELTLNFRGHSPPQVDLRSLFSLAMLQVLSIAHPDPLSYDGHIIGDMLACMPRLYSLSLNPRPSNGLGPTSLPLATILQDVARCAPLLKRFHALLDFFVLPDSRLSLPVLSHESVQYLDLGFSIGSMSEDDLPKAVDWLIPLFPKVEVERYGCGDWSAAFAHAHRTQNQEDNDPQSRLRIRFIRRKAATLAAEVLLALAFVSSLYLLGLW